MNRFLRYVELNLSELCNYTCDFCPRGHGYENQNLHMSLETADIICQQIEALDVPVRVQLAGRGEPTLCKNFGPIAEKLLSLRDRVQGLELEMNTNGKWVDNYLPLIERFNDVVYNVYPETTESPKELQNKYPQFRVKDKRDVLSRNWKTRAGYIPDQISPEPAYNHPKYGGMCHKPFQVVYINWNGDYNLCCDVWKDIEALGNIRTETIAEFTTKNPRLGEYRNSLAKGRRTMDPCKDCNIQCAVDFLQDVQALQNV